MAEVTDFPVDLIEQRYVAYVPHDRYNVIIAAIFHESMDLPRHLQSLRAMSADEIKALKQMLRAAKAH